MAASIAGVFEEKLQKKIVESKILVVGAGGIGCEVLKNLVLSGFADIEIVSAPYILRSIDKHRRTHDPLVFVTNFMCVVYQPVSREFSVDALLRIHCPLFGSCSFFRYSSIVVAVRNS